MFAGDLAGRIVAVHLEAEKVLRDRDVGLHAEGLGDMGDAARAVAQALGLDGYVDGFDDADSSPKCNKVA
jgi:hypothetical protein